MVVSVLAAMYATATASVATAKIAMQDNPARKVRNVDRALNVMSAVVRTKRATNAQTKPPRRRQP